MAIINQSTIVLNLIISYSLGLDLFGRSKIDTQETSLNVVLVPSLLTFENSPPKHYLMSQIIYLLIMFFLVRNSKEYEILALDGVSFYYLKMSVNLTQYRRAVVTFKLERAYFNRAVKHFLS